MKKMNLIFAMFLLLTGCSERETLQDSGAVALQKIYDNSGGRGDATAITMADIEAAGAINLIADNLPQYQTAIASKTDFSTPPKVEEVQSLVKEVNKNCGCYSDQISDFQKVIVEIFQKESVEIYYQTASRSPDDPYNNRYWMVISVTGGITYLMVVCNEELIPNDLKKQLSSGEEAVDVVVSGKLKDICIRPISRANDLFFRIVLTSIERK